MPEHSTKLYFFGGVRGRAEIPRLLLIYSGTKFEDIKISKGPGKDQWPAMKEKMPTGVMPVLEVDGKKLCQSTAIARYVARECGLAGKNSWDMARADMMVEGVYDMWGHLKAVYLPKLDGDKKTSDEKWAQMVSPNGTVKPFLDFNTRFLKENGGQYFVGDSLTYADIAVAEMMSELEDCFCQNILDNYPELKAFKEKILSLPKLKEHVSQRPATPM